MRDEMCGKVPKCDQCQLAEVCFMFIAKNKQSSQPECAIGKCMAEPQERQASQPPLSPGPVPGGTLSGGQCVRFESTLTCRTKKSSGDFVNIPDEYVSLFPPPNQRFDIHTVDGKFGTCIVPPHEGGRSHFHSKEFFDQHKDLQSGDGVEIRVSLGPVRTYYLRPASKGGKSPKSGS